MSLSPAQAAVVALVGAFALTPLVRMYSIRRGLIDQPGIRRNHDAPIARGGGVAIGLALVLTALLLAPGDPFCAPFVGGAGVVCLLGWLDDHASLAVVWRLGVQVLAAVAVVAVIGPVETVRAAGFSIPAVWLWSPLAVLAIIWLVNLFNFMDGSDGLASTQAVISCTLYALAFKLEGAHAAASLALITAAATLGFLFWNWPRARVFLGDSGSLLLGWCVGCLALIGTVGDSIPVGLAFVIVSPFVVDATATLCWRVIRRERWYTAHSEHAYQYLIRAGWSHRRVLLTWLVLNGVLVMPATALVLWKPRTDLAVAAFVTIVLGGAWYLVHFVVAKTRITT